MSWLDRPASPTQITHGRRLWLYVIAALVLAFLVVPMVGAFFIDIANAIVIKVFLALPVFR